MTIRTRSIKPWYLSDRVRFPEMVDAHWYCGNGPGIELGAAAHNPFGLPGAVNCAPYSEDPSDSDHADYMLYADAQSAMCGEVAAIDIVGTANAIPVEDASQDYVISSHVVEHIPNLLGAFVEWNRVLRPTGVVFMIFPKRDALPSDRGREITPVEHFVEDYQGNLTEATHEPKEVPRGHYHVFTLQSMLDLIAWANANLDLGWEVVMTEKTDSKVGNGHTVVCRRTTPVSKLLEEAEQTDAVFAGLEEAATALMIREDALHHTDMTTSVDSEVAEQAIRPSLEEAPKTDRRRKKQATAKQPE